MAVHVPHALLVLDEADVRALLTPAVAVESQRNAFRHLADPGAQAPPRLTVPRGADGLAFCYLADAGPDLPVVCKVGSFVPANTAAGLPAIGAVALVLDPVTGLPAAIVDGDALTEIRTAAASVLAAEQLAPDARSLAVLGSGVQAAAHVRAFCAVRGFDTVRMWGRNGDRIRTLAARLGAELGTDVATPATAADAVADADLVVLCTSARDPVFAADRIADGATVISVGSVSPDRHEVDQDLLERADAVVVDDPREAVVHVGPVVAAKEAGRLSQADLVPLGAVVTGAAPGRRGPGDLVVYFSVGLGTQDAAAAAVVWAVACDQGRGRRVRL